MKGSQVVTFDTLRSVAFGSITGSYTALGAVFTHTPRIVKINNDTDGAMLISFDGTTNHDFVSAGGSVVYDFTTNKESASETFVLPVGTQVYIKSSTAPSKSAVYLTTIYGRGQ